MASQDEYCEQIEREMHNAYYAQECAINEIMAMTVHEPIALPKDPKDVDEARTMWTGRSGWRPVL